MIRANPAFAIYYLLWQRPDRQHAAESRVVAQGRVATNGTQAVRRVGQACGKADAGPATNAREDTDVLLALVLVGEHVADDARGGFVFIELLAILLIDT